MKQFNAYVHARPDTTTAEGIFYVGKGSGKRHTDMVNNRNQHHKNTTKKYGAENILIGKIDCSSEQTAFDLEIGLIKCLRRMSVKLVNQTSGGDGIPNFNHSEKTKKRLSETHIGHAVSAETRAKISAGNKGRKVSEVSRRKMSEAQKRMPREVRDRISSTLKGRKASEETRAKMRASAKGKTLTKEHREKIGAAHKGRVISEETRAKISKSHTGKITSPEHCKALSEALKASWARRRGGKS